MPRLALLICAIYALPLFADEALDRVLARMDKGASSFKAMSAKIRKVSHTAVVNENTVDTGTMKLKRAKPRDMRMLVDLTEPDQKAMAFQGQKLEMYFPKMRTVQEYDVGKNRELLEQFLLLGFGTSGKELAENYTLKVGGTETVGEQKTTRLELVPKSKEVLQHLKKAELWVSDETGYPAQQKFYLTGGDYALVTYTELKVNPQLSDSALKLNLPKGVKREFPQK